MPSCGNNCRIFTILADAAGAALHDGLPINPAIFITETFRICISCTNYVSDYEHSCCYQCALPNTVEFYYHHQRCFLIQQEQN